MRTFRIASICILFSAMQVSVCSQWTRVSINPEETIEALDFLDDNIGYGLIKNEVDQTKTIVKTINGGENWTSISIPLPGAEIQDLDFYEDGIGVVLVRDLNQTITPTMIFKTYDNGVNWESITPPETPKGVGVGQCLFLNDSVGYFATDKSVFITSDSGANWKEVHFEKYILSIDFSDDKHGVLGTWDGTFAYKGSIFTTRDGGDNWKEYRIATNYSSINEVIQISDNVIYAASIHNWSSINATQVFKSTDGGQNWQELIIPIQNPNSTLRQVDFITASEGVICVGNSSEAEVYVTLDGGTNWTFVNSIQSGYDMDLVLTPGTGYICGMQGAFYKNTSLNSIQSNEDIDNWLIYPCPVRSGQNIYWNEDIVVDAIYIFDQTGKLVQLVQPDKNYFTVDIEPGNYIFMMANKLGFTTSRIVVY